MPAGHERKNVCLLGEREFQEEGTIKAKALRWEVHGIRDTQVVQGLSKRRVRGVVTIWAEVNREHKKWLLNKTSQNIVCYYFCGIIRAKDDKVSVAPETLGLF